ncbi:MAG: exodeoxyribonuclease VII small subunit [Spirochaetia bacterium]
MKNFEERLKRLEEISRQIRDGEIPLEKAAGLFEEGVTLARGLEKELDRIDRKVQQLINEPTEPGEKPVLELFPELSGITESESD